MAISTTLLTEDQFTLHQQYLLAAALLGREIPVVQYLLDDLVDRGFIEEQNNGANRLTELGSIAVCALNHRLTDLAWPEFV